MKAMVLREFGQPLSWEEVPEPRIGPCQALVQSKANGLCATDLKIVDGLVKSARPPLLLGHESAGVVVEVGPEVESVRTGDRVVMVAKHSRSWEEMPCHPSSSSASTS
jgi:D-arabinose 1-dehydrogenase-like Zn-dependent alcohol dehydrogenase